MKKCSKCKTLKLFSEFHKNKRMPDGYNYLCKKCISKYYQNNKNKIAIHYQNSLSKAIRWKKWLYNYGMILQMKKCAKCQKWLDLNNFDNHKNGKGGLQSQCKKCRNKYNKQFFQNNKEKRDLRKIVWKKWLKDNKEYNKEYAITLAKYKPYAHQIEFCEDIRKDNNLLQVRCTETNCRKWFNPTNAQVRSRISTLNGNMLGESRFYCSDECKSICTIYAQSSHSKDNKPNNSREVQPELRQMVLERDNYECQRCGIQNDLECHHYESINYNPIMSADVDMCVTLCETCHELAHSDKGCRYSDLTKIQLCAA